MEVHDHPVRTKFFHADGQTDRKRQDKAHNHFSHKINKNTKFKLLLSNTILSVSMV